MSVGESLPYRSPISKLLRFFCRSRDKWKAKCKAAKRENKSLKYRLAVMTENRNRWKAEARGLRKSTPDGTEQAVEEPSKNRAGRACRGRQGRAAGPGIARAR
jgi:hypothetical protein